MSWTFKDCENLLNISGLTNWDVSNVTNMEYMFSNCNNITNLSPLANWNVSNVTNMNTMFSSCKNLTDASGINAWGTRLNPNLTKNNMFTTSYTTTLPSWYV